MKTNRSKKAGLAEVNGVYSSKVVKTTEVIITEEEVRRIVAALVVVHKATAPITAMWRGIKAVGNTLKAGVNNLLADATRRREEKKAFHAWVASQAIPATSTIPTNETEEYETV